MVILMGMAIPTSAGAQEAKEPKRLLFYGNSFTGSNDVPGSVSRLARAAGHPAPVIVRNLKGGANMAWHLEQTGVSPGHNIAAEAVADTGYDAVILQGFSTEPTRQGGREAFVLNTLELARRVRAREAGKKATLVLYQTWARGPGHEMYPERFESPAQMQQELIEGYEAARKALVEEFGQESVRLAPVGAVFASTGFESELYWTDLYHTGQVGSLLSAMVLYRTLYGGTIADIDPQTLAEIRDDEHWSSITDKQWNWLAKTADRFDVARAATQPTTAPTSRAGEEPPDA